VAAGRPAHDIKGQVVGDDLVFSNLAGTEIFRITGGTGGTADASEVTAEAISPGTATNVQGILAELAARITALETP
jgi:hypothetical protein